MWSVYLCIFLTLFTQVGEQTVRFNIEKVPYAPTLLEAGVPVESDLIPVVVPATHCANLTGLGVEGKVIPILCALQPSQCGACRLLSWTHSLLAG